MTTDSQSLETQGKDGVGIEKIEQTYEGLYDGKPNIITIYLTNGDKHEFKVLNGSQGVSIDRIVQTSSSTASGGRNEFSIILTNGKEYPFSVYNGSGGTDAGSTSFNQVLRELNNLIMPSEKSFLYYSGTQFQWKSLGDSGISSDSVDLTKYKWWGRKFNDGDDSKNDSIYGTITIFGTIQDVFGIRFCTSKNSSFTKSLYLDDNGDLCFDGNFYATGGITALGSGGGTSGDGSGASLGTLLTAINAANPTPSTSGQVLYYDGSTYLWKSVAGASGSGINTVKLFNSEGNCFETIGLGTATTVGLMAGDNVTLESVTKEYTNVIKISASGSGSSSGSIQVGTTPAAGYSQSWISGTKLRIYGNSGISKVSVAKNTTYDCVDVIIPYSSSGSGGSFSGTTTNSLYFYGSGTAGGTPTNMGGFDGSEATYLKFQGSGVTVSQSGNTTTVNISGGSGSTSSSDVYWSNILSKPTTLSGYGILSSDTLFDSKYLSKSATAAAATKLATARTIWGQSFNGTVNVSGDMSDVGNVSLNGSINWTDTKTSLSSTSYEICGSSSQKTPFIDFHYYTGSNVDFTARLIADAENTLGFSTNSGAGTFNLNNNKLKIGNGTLEWDSTNSCFKINGSVYATGGITALGVSNSSTTSNNVDFTFNSVTAKNISLSNGSFLSETAEKLMLHHSGSVQEIILSTSNNDVDDSWKNIIDTNTMSFQNADWYFFDNDVVCLGIKTKGVTFFDEQYDEGGTLNDIRIKNGTSGGTALIFTIDGKQYTINVN